LLSVGVEHIIRRDADGSGGVVLVAHGDGAGAV
jgi:hypothetical protein